MWNIYDHVIIISHYMIVFTSHVASLFHFTCCNYSYREGKAKMRKHCLPRQLKNKVWAVLIKFETSRHNNRLIKLTAWLACIAPARAGWLDFCRLGRWWWQFGFFGPNFIRNNICIHRHSILHSPYIKGTMRFTEVWCKKIPENPIKWKQYVHFIHCIRSFSCRNLVDI